MTPSGSGCAWLYPGSVRPAGRSVAADFGRTQIIRQRRTQRLFITLLNLEPVHDLPALGGVALDKLGQRRHLGAQRVDLTFGFRTFAACLGLFRLRIGARIVCRNQRGLGGLRRLDSGLFSRKCRIMIGTRGRQRVFRRGNRLTRPHRLGLGFFKRFLTVAQQPLRRLVPRRQPRHILGQLAQIILAILQDAGRIPGLFRGGFQTGFVPFTRLGQLLRFPFQPLDGLASITVQPAFAFDVMGKLFDPVFQRRNPVPRACFLLIQRIALHLQPLQDCRRDRLFFTQRW